MNNDTATPTKAPKTQRVLRVEFHTTDWQLSNDMRMPRGRGSRAFSRKRNPDVMNKGEVFFTPSMTYGDAKKLARDHFLSLVPADVTGVHFVDVWVLS